MNDRLMQVGQDTSFQDVQWARCEVSLATRHGQTVDARQMFIQIVGQEPERFVRKKIATPTFPCLGWAHGSRDGWEYDLRLGLDGDMDELRLRTHNRGLGPTLIHLMACARMDGGGDFRLTLEVGADGNDAVLLADRWLLEGGKSKFVTSKHAFTLSKGDQPCEVSLAINRDPNSPSIEFGVRISAESKNAVFGVLRDVLQTKSLDELSA
jgi:hypothetical protein